MRKIILVTAGLLLAFLSFSQTINQNLRKAFQQFENDPQLKHAMTSLYVIEAKTGQIVFDKNSQVGLAPASTQKIITSITAFELLGSDYRYKTDFGYNGEVKNGILEGNLGITGSGDPTFGSDRFGSTSEGKIFRAFAQALQKKNITSVYGSFTINTSSWQSQGIPDGWIWQDLGNYYGAGAGGLNWKENQFDIILSSGSKINDPVKIKTTNPELFKTTYISELRSAAKKSGDRAFIYLPMNSVEGYLRGTIPLGEEQFKISGAMPDPRAEFEFAFVKYFSGNSPENLVFFKQIPEAGATKMSDRSEVTKPLSIIYSHYSPPLDTIIYWLNKKSINLYAEALVKTIAYERKGIGSIDSGVAIVKNFWKQKGLDEDELNISDGSGLSPQNRVTTHTQVEILKFARSKKWFPSFFNSLPLYNGMSMKSGTIKDVKGFCGYQKGTDGREYIFSFLVNNYNGATSALVDKMYKVLDVLKP